MKKIWVPILIILFLLILPIFIMNIYNIGFTTARCVAADNGSYLYVDGDSPISMSNLTSNTKLFSDLKTGDKILVVHERWIEETYPGRTGVYFCYKFEDGSVDDIPNEVIDGLTELGWLYENISIKTSKAVEYGHENVRIALELPENWEYSIDEYSEESYYGINIWPKGCSEGKLLIQCYDGFGVCGTGLTEKEISIAGMDARMGIYDNNAVWNFIVFTEFQNDFVILNQGTKVWWSEYADEAMSILETIQIRE